MSKENEFVCEHCGYPAASATVFRSDESPYSETLECPKCKNVEITTRRLSKFKKGWRLIIESGLRDEVDQIPGAYLQLAEKDEQRIELGNMKMTEVPPTIAIKLQTKMNELQEIVKNSGILDELDAEGVRLDLRVSG